MQVGILTAFAITFFRNNISSLCFVSLSAISLPCSTAFPVSLGCGLPAWYSGLQDFDGFLVVSYLPMQSGVLSLSNVFTLLLPKREPILSAMLAAAVVAAPFSFSVCISIIKMGP